MTWTVSDEEGQSEEIAAILRADGTWAVPAWPRLAAMLDDLYRDDFRRSGPDRGIPGREQLNALAARVSGRVDLVAEAPAHADRDY